MTWSPPRLCDALAEFDVGTAAGHVGRDGDGGGLTGVGDDGGLALVLLGVEHFVFDAAAGEQVREHLRGLDRDGADEDGATGLVLLGDVFDDGAPLGGNGTEDEVREVLAGDVAVGGDDDDFEFVDLGEFFGLGDRGTGHAGERFVEAEEVLDGDGGVGDGLLLDLDALLGLDGLVEAVRPAAAFHEAAGEGIDDDDLVVLDDVVDGRAGR